MERFGQGCIKKLNIIYSATYRAAPEAPRLPTGMFKLHSNRKELWCGADAGDDGSYNQSLLVDSIAPLWAEAMNIVSGLPSSDSITEGPSLYK